MEDNKKIKERTKNKKVLLIIIMLIILVFIIVAIIYIKINKANDNCAIDKQSTFSVFEQPIMNKPIIYLYPEKEIKLSVELGKPENITCSYPKYINGWNVIAQTNGNLINTSNGRKLYSLYYESNNEYNFSVQDEGFVVEKSNVIQFLEEKLILLGLTEREMEEFIIYWLPKLEENEYNYIRFATLEEINRNMPLKFSINPDTLIRVLMTYKGLKEPIKIKEQKLVTPERKGFVAVEWGGTEIQ